MKQLGLCPGKARVHDLASVVNNVFWVVLVQLRIAHND
jgi:hypothetical protein